MQNIILSELKLGLVQFDWTFIFQILNTALWVLIIVVIYKAVQKNKEKKRLLEARVDKLEEELDKLHGE